MFFVSVCVCVYVCVPPHGVCDTHRSTEERGEAEEGDEDGGHLADSVRLPGSLTVHHHAALWGEQNTGQGQRSLLPSQQSGDRNLMNTRGLLSFCYQTTVSKVTNVL